MVGSLLSGHVIRASTSGVAVPYYFYSATYFSAT
jgi:hypothetical protein